MNKEAVLKAVNLVKELDVPKPFFSRYYFLAVC
jgi:hypothetical protein